MPGNGRPSYHVSYTEPVQLTLRALGEKATKLGMGDEFIAVLRQVDAKLHSEPTSLGEPLFPGRCRLERSDLRNRLLLSSLRGRCG